LPTLVSVYYHFVGRDDPLIPASPVTREIHELPHRPGNPRPTTARLAAHSLILLIIGIIVIDLAGQAIHVYYAIGTGGGAIAATIAYSTWAFPYYAPEILMPDQFALRGSVLEGGALTSLVANQNQPGLVWF
jgi:hypothetical protein